MDQLPVRMATERNPYGIASNMLNSIKPSAECNEYENWRTLSGEMQYRVYDMDGTGVGQGMHQNATINSEFAIDVNLPPHLHHEVTYPDDIWRCRNL